MNFPVPTSGLSAFLSAAHEQRLGVVVGGSLSKGLLVKLDRGQSVEDLAVGRYVVVRGDNGVRYFCMLTDVSLNSTNPAIQNHPPELQNDAFLRDVYIGTAVYGTVNVAPTLSIDEKEGNKPVKTIPGHFAPVYNATAEDVNRVFGAEDDGHFNMGSPLELSGTNINLDLKRLTERSVGVFGKSGTGKSFLTRLLLAGVIRWGKAVNLVFDMHNDYGWAATNEGGTHVKALKQLFPHNVSIITLDGESSRRRGVQPEMEVRLSYNDIDPEDIANLRATMNLSDAMIDAAYTLRRRWGKGWIHTLLDDQNNQLQIEEIVENTNIGAGTLAALQRRLQRFERWEFLTAQPAEDSVKRIIDLIISQRKHVVLEFGRFGNELEAYMLVANYLTRRIRDQYVDMVEKALGDQAMMPPQLVITIEEAHKFLDPAVASQTIFGVIARELRKYNVTLLVVDQRPSGIDEEVMSQIGTRITALLDNEKDINAVLNGVNGAQGLREVLARLDTKQQAIIMGHAVPMPVVVKTRSYDEDFYAAMAADDRRPSSSATRNVLGSGGRERRL